jgi:hypothetical protein
MIVESIVQQVPDEGGNLSRNYWQELLDGLCDGRSKANGGFRYERFAESGT